MINHEFIMYAVEKKLFNSTSKSWVTLSLQIPLNPPVCLWQPYLIPFLTFENTQKITEYHSWTTSPREIRLFYNLYHYNTNICKIWTHSLDHLVLVLHRIDCTGSHCFILQRLEDYPCWGKILQK